jgi:hypothetical protein
MKEGNKMVPQLIIGQKVVLADEQFLSLLNDVWKNISESDQFVIIWFL